MGRIIRQRKRMTNFLIIACVFIISSCAGLGIYPSAQYEFDQGLALFNRGRYEEAVAHFQKATEIDPEFAKAYLYLGRSYLNLAQWLNALAPLRTALRLSPAETRKEVVGILLDALFGAASHELKKGNFKGAIGFLKEALELQPQSDRASKELFEAFMAFGGKLLSEGNPREAIGAFSEAVKLSPHTVDAHLGLARAFLKGGDLLKALQTVKDALKIDPTNKDAQSLFREFMRR